MTMMMTIKRRCICSLFFFLLAFTNKIQASFSVSVVPGTEECIIFRTPANRESIISASFDCLDDDLDADTLTVSVIDNDTGESLWEASRGAHEATFSMDDVKRGTRYALCFQNNHDDEEEETLTVGFNIRVTSPPRTLPDAELGPDGQRALKLVKQSTKILQDWENLMDHFDFLRNREAVHKKLTDGILNRITRWNQIEAFLVIGMALGQVMYWRKFFETRRYL
jgi:hypothetical protein